MLCNNSGGINVTTNRQTQISKIIRILVVATEYSTEYKLRASSRQRGFNHYDNPTSTNKIVAILLKSPKHQLRHKYIYISLSLSQILLFMLHWGPLDPLKLLLLLRKLELLPGVTTLFRDHGRPILGTLVTF